MEFSSNDYVNLRKLLDRVQVKGVQESIVLSVLAQKLETKIAEYQPQEEPNGEDVPPAN